uniref:Uncharacterized protein n=1 Tax=Musa acuminata subsp. malaccensis TaxID=214687 RepID=A0A804I7C9_MUSAM|nr:PREDICTED: uncharacterized protein LOC103977174 [Musa acuminata subsp. malaccensis]
MAHQSKFVSVNLNRSYGQPSSSSSSSVHGRSRPGSGGGGGGGGGMVVLSRSRSSATSAAKTAQKLAVPPPLNLPSLRKEHERFDPASSGSAATHGSPGLGSRGGTSALGWSKPALPVPEKDAGSRGQSQLGRSAIINDELAGSSYISPGARPGGQPLNATPGQGFSEKAVILRGEDFPSLRATFTSPAKQKDTSSQKQKQKLGVEEQSERREVSELHSPLQMRPQIKSSRLIANSMSDGDGGLIRPLCASEQSQRQDRDLPGLLPLVRLQHTSDWTDDERDIGLSIPERERDRGFLRSELVQVHDAYDGRGLHDTEGGSAWSREPFKGYPSGKDVRAASNESQDFVSWRFPMNSRDRLNTSSPGVDRDRHYARPISGNREVSTEGVNIQSSFGENGSDGFAKRSQDYRNAKMDLVSSEHTRIGKVVAEAFSGTHGHGHSNNWSKGSSFQNATVLKGQFSTGTRGTSLNDPTLNFGREKRSAPSAGKPYLEDTEFDSKDPFLGGIRDMNAKAYKKKKDLEKQIDFPDPIRESFEAELEGILRTQEQERQRIVEEQARALELARKEEEERERVAREEEEQRRTLEEEARNAAWKAEQERLDAARRAEEQRIAREEEKRRYQMEEERRTEAARKKLLELEARIARRQVEDNGKDDRVHSSVTASEERVPGVVKERDVPQDTEVGGWEDGERMVEQITSSALFDSLSVDRILEVGPKSQFPRDTFPSFAEREKHAYGRTILPSQADDNLYHNPRQDAFGHRGGFSKKEFHGGIETRSSRPSSKGATMIETSQRPDEYHEPRKQRWNSNKEVDYFKRNNDINSEFIDSVKFRDVGMVPGNSQGSPQAPYTEISSDNPVVDGFSSFTRYRQFLRQPRVPPPPSVTSVQRSSFRDPAEGASSSCFIDDDVHYNHPSRYEQKTLHRGFDNVFHETHQQGGTTAFLEKNASQFEQEAEKMSPRYDSQLSPSVSSPPSSPALLHHEMDISRDSPPLPASADGERTIVSDSEHIVLPLEGGAVDRMMASRSISPGVDDEWPVENNEEIQEQEGDEYQDIAEAHDGVDENFDSVQEIEDLHSDVQTTTGEMEQVILGFNEGVEVKLPSIDKFEITSSNSEKEFRIHAGSAGNLEESISNCEIIVQEDVMDSSLQSEPEKSLKDLSLDPISASSYSVNGAEASQSSRLPAQHSVTSATSCPMTSTASDSPNLSFPSIVVSQGEAPVSLQFGLFSGPSLIPSPVPAIQIGSIQMPIHMHTHINPSLPQVHPSQPPLFQFGQLRYTPTISHSILPLAPTSTAFIQPSASAPYSFNQNPAGSLCDQTTQNYYSDKSRDEKPSGSSHKQTDLVKNPFESSQHRALLDSGKNVSIASQSRTEISSLVEKKGANNSISQAESHGEDDATMKKGYRLTGKWKESQHQQQHTELQSSRFFPGGKPPLRNPGNFSGGRRKRYTYSVKNAGTRSSFPGEDTLQAESSGFQRRARRNIRRTEFGVRENIARKQTQGTESLNSFGQDEKSNEDSMATGISIRNLDKKDAPLDRSVKIANDPDNLSSGASISLVVSSDRTERVIRNETTLKSESIFDKSHAGKGNIKAGDSLEGDVDAPLLSGVIRVFKQTGIEVPSNEDDFIEVRSKRQMLNDRREQRAKENKSKSRVPKGPGKQFAVPQSNAASSNPNKAVTSSVSDTTTIVCANSLVAEGRESTRLKSSFVTTANLTSQTLPPIGTPSVNADFERRLNDSKSGQAIIVPAVSDSESILVPGLLENKNTCPEYTVLPLSSWDSTHTSHQVIALTQTQLDEAMKPTQFGSQLVSSIILEPHKLVSSIVTPEKPFSSCASPVNSLLADEKIQFGAVMPPNILPPVSRAISKGTGPPNTCRPELKIGQNLSNNSYSMFFVKEQCPGEPCADLEDAEAEAEAAASAVAVAAITNDEMVGSGIGTASDTKSFSSADGTALASAGAANSHEVTGQSSCEESLTVALPADLSVDTALSVWPALPSPQTSQSVLSQFPGASPSHFPSFEMNGILDGRIFAYGSNDESAGSQGQPQKGAALGSGALGSWPQYHPGVDSFYRPPAGFTGPFINPGGIPGVQCPPHMVFYNHFAPVGQFGQVGVGFMGTTYIPAGKQPEWKQNQVCSTVNDSEGDLSNLNAVSGQGTPTSAPAIQNLGPGSPLMVASPLTMFDMNPFQPAANIPLQAWSHVPPPLHSIPLSMPLQQHHVESRIPSQLGRNLSGDATTGNNRFGDPRPSVNSEISRSIPFPNSTASEISDELGPPKQPTCGTATTQTVVPRESTASANEKKDLQVVARTIVSGIDSRGTRASSSEGSGQTTGLPSKSLRPTSSGQQHHNQAGHEQHRGISQRTGSGGEWHRRTTGFQVRKQGSGMDKNNGPPKMKQIYVAKPSSSGLSSQGQTKT